MPMCVNREVLLAVLLILHYLLIIFIFYYNGHVPKILPIAKIIENEGRENSLQRKLVVLPPRFSQYVTVSLLNIAFDVCFKDAVQTTMIQSFCMMCSSKGVRSRMDGIWIFDTYNSNQTTLYSPPPCQRGRFFSIHASFMLSQTPLRVRHILFFGKRVANA